MKWELVVTDPVAGKSGRVRIEAANAAAAERIARNKGWTVSSIRAYEQAAPVAAPVAEPAVTVSRRVVEKPVAPAYMPPAETHSSSSDDATDHAESQPDHDHETGYGATGYPNNYDRVTEDTDETQPDTYGNEAADESHTAAPPEEHTHVPPAYSNEAIPDAPVVPAPATPSMTSGFGLARQTLPTAEAYNASTDREEVAPAPPRSQTQRPPSWQPASGGNVTVGAAERARPPSTGGMSSLFGTVFWIAGLALIGLGVMHLAYYLGYAQSNQSADDSARILEQIRQFSRGAMAGVFIIAGLLSATLGTMLARRR